TGGKFTTFRLMAKDTVDALCAEIGVDAPCRTDQEALPDSGGGRYYWLGARLDEREKTLHNDQLICECELVPRKKLESAIQRRQTNDLDDVRRTLRLGMGPCQGG